MHHQVRFQLIISIMFLSIASFGQSTKKTKIERLVRIDGNAKLIEQMTTNYVETFKAMSKTTVVKNRAKYDAFIKFLMDETTAIADRVLYKELPAVYDKYFTEQEIDDIIKFDMSSTGKKLMQTTPLIQSYLTEVMMKSEYPQLKIKINQKLAHLRYN